MLGLREVTTRIEAQSFAENRAHGVTGVTNFLLTPEASCESLRPQPLGCRGTCAGTRRTRPRSCPLPVVAGSRAGRT